MIGVALLGAGIFAREQYLPAIAESQSLVLRAVYSRSEKTAIATARLATKQRPDLKVDTYFDEAIADGMSLDDLLARKDITAVIACLSIPVQAGIVKKAILAGKHVLSEKPIAKDVATASDLLSWYGRQMHAPVWAVAENFRLNESVQYATEAVRQLGGQLASFRLIFSTLIANDNKYVQTEWRKSPDFQGGFLLDGGVHFIATLRMLLGSTGDQIERVTAHSALLQSYLPPVDTVQAVAVTKGGRGGTINLSYGIEFGPGLQIEIVTTKGAVIWTPTKVQTVTRSASGDRTEHVREFIYDNAVRTEIEAFAQSTASGVPHPLLTPAEALGDLKLLQTILESGTDGKMLAML